MKSRKMLSLLLAALLAMSAIPTAFAAEGADDTAAPSASVEGDAAPTEGDTAQTEGEAAPTEGDAAPTEGDAAPTEGEAAPTEGEAAPTEGEATPTEDDADPAKDDAQVVIPVVEKKKAVLSASSVLVNGEPVAFDAYTIDGFNYFKLRDIAAAVTGTDAAFNVAWNAEAFCIELTGGTNYEKVDGDLVAGVGAAEVTASSTSMAILLNGESVELSGYSIDGNTYFQLRDLGDKLGFTVSWNADVKSIGIETAKETAPAEPSDKGTAADEKAETEPTAEGTENDASGDDAGANAADGSDRSADGADA